MTIVVKLQYTYSVIILLRQIKSQNSMFVMLANTKKNKFLADIRYNDSKLEKSIEIVVIHSIVSLIQTI